MSNEKYCVFLRGINVNGIKIKMQDLKTTFLNLGFSEVKTILATGNVIFSLKEVKPEFELKEYIETELRKVFQYDAHVMLRSRSNIDSICQKARELPLQEEHHLYVLLCESEEVVGELVALFDTVEHSESEQVLPLRTELIWIVAKGETLESQFGSKILGSKKYKDKLTSRNINTLEKMLI